MYEVIGESVKSAVSIKLGDIFRVATTQNGQTTYVYPKRYKEAVTNIQYPNFFIYQVSLDITPDTRNRWNLDYLMNVRYRYVEDVETVTNIEQQLDAVGLKLLTEFTEIQLERPVKVKNARYEKADGVLQFFFNVPVRIQRELTAEQKMEILSLNERLKKEDE